MNKNENESVNESSHDHIRNLAMDSKGKIHAGSNGTAVTTRNMTLLIVLGWICAALTAFVSSLFAIAGIVLGVLLNRSIKGRGNTIIITNVVLAIINVIFGLYLLTATRNILG